MKLRRRHHNLLFFTTLALTAVCGFLMTRVNVNSDMTKYLPDNSRMKQGLEILAGEFGGQQMTAADVRVMYTGLAPEEVTRIADSLATLPEVEGVSCRNSADGVYTLYELNVPKSIDQKSFGKEIRKNSIHEVIVETSQDGNTPPASVMIIAASLILLILFLMAQSWLEPLIFGIATGVSIVLNIGTNALLPSVSITTNYIVAILQMVLSLDYSIVMMNRYRQEKHEDNATVEAVNAAMRRAAPSILSSALTTVVGLIMLVFMRLKIGADMGIVLAKGVVFSLICTFTVLPTLLMLFHKGVMNTGKKTFLLPTDKLSRFVTRHKMPLAIFALALFFCAFFLSRRTEISFEKKEVSRIDKVFPKKNAMLVIYDTEKEMSSIGIADSLLRENDVEQIISYPTLLKQKYTAEEMTGEITRLAAGFGSMMPGTEGMDMLTPELMRVVYYMKLQDDGKQKIAFPDLSGFIMSHCVDNPMFAGLIDEGMKEKLSMMADMTGFVPEETEEAPADDEIPARVSGTEAGGTPQSEEKTEKKPDSGKEEAPIKVVSTAPARNSGSISMVNFMPKLHYARPSAETEVLADIVDTALLRKKMAAPEMGGFIGSTSSQTKMVYSLSKVKTMTPLEYVHFLSDDLFNRKALASFVNSEQKRGLRARMKVMDYANADVKVSAADMLKILAEFGISGMTEEDVRNIAFPKPAEPVVPEKHTGSPVPAATAPTCPAETPADTAANAIADTSAVAAAPSDSASAASTEIRENPKPVAAKPVKTLAQRREELFLNLLSSKKGYTAGEMARMFRRLGENIDEGYVELLYAYYGSVNDYDGKNTMSIEELLDYVSSAIMDDPRFTAFIDGKTRESFTEARGQMKDGIGMMRNENHSLMAIITDLPAESAQTYTFMDRLDSLCKETFGEGGYTMVGESCMYNEMKNGFGREVTLVTLLTVIAIFIIVALAFKSIIVPAILVMTVMTAVYVNVLFSGIVSGTMLYLAYLIVQSILMGATIDYGILFTNYYKEMRQTLPINEAVTMAYRGSIRTIMTSGLIMVAAPGAMSLMVDDATISAIVGCLSIGAFVAIVLILAVLPGVLVAFDRIVVRKRTEKIEKTEKE